jgi:glycosyltransferase involved in cell wall biosynthesis
MTQPLVSIVTPFYNTDEFLADCINSVLAQTYSNWEYILVNNCSSDQSLDIATAYAAKDPRIKLVSNEKFLGQVDNYNRAMSLIDPASKYVKMVQADDWIFPECLSRMVALAEQHPQVGVVGAYQLSESFVSCQGLPYQTPVVSGATVIRMYLFDNSKFLFGQPTAIMYRADLVRARQPFYDTDSAQEDTDVCIDLLLLSDFGFVHQVLTFRRMSNESASSSIRRLTPYPMHDFITLLKYGHRVLNDEEYRRCYRHTGGTYFRLMGGKFLTNHDPAFWKYHRQGLASVGYELTKLRLCRWALSAIIDWLGNPKRNLARWIAERRLSAGGNLHG